MITTVKRKVMMSWSRQRRKLVITTIAATCCYDDDDDDATIFSILYLSILMLYRIAKAVFYCSLVRSFVLKLRYINNALHYITLQCYDLILPDFVIKQLSCTFWCVGRLLICMTFASAFFGCDSMRILVVGGGDDDDN